MKNNREDIIHYLKSLGADIAGVCKYNNETKGLLIRDEMIDKRNYRSIVVIGMYIVDPYLDMWLYFDEIRRLSPADDFLAHIILRACLKLERDGFHSIPLLYNSIYLIDAAYQAKLGIIGKNNLLITPEFGPRVRLNALLTEMDLPIDNNLLYNPCCNCDAPCVKACPVNALNNCKFDNESCKEYSSKNPKQISSHTTLWCRECETACLVGNTNNRFKKNGRKGT